MLLFIHDFVYGIHIKSHKCYEIEITYCTYMKGEQKIKMKDAKYLNIFSPQKILNEKFCLDRSTLEIPMFSFFFFFFYIRLRYFRRKVNEKNFPILPIFSAQ